MTDPHEERSQRQVLPAEEPSAIINQEQTSQPANSPSETIEVGGARPDEVSAKPAASSEANVSQETKTRSAAPSQTAEPPIELDALEAEIRGRLEGVIKRAKKLKRDAENLFRRVEPIRQTETDLKALSDESGRTIAPMLDPVRSQSRLRAEAIRQLGDSIRRGVDVHYELLDALADASQEFQAIVQSPAENWFEIVRAREINAKDKLGGIREWLERAEKRWTQHPTTAGAAPEEKAAGMAGSPVGPSSLPVKSRRRLR